MDDQNGLTIYEPELLPVDPRRARAVTRNDVEDFLDRQDIMPSSKALYRLGLDRLFRWLEVNGITHPHEGDLLRFKTFLAECCNLRPTSVNAYLCGVKGFFSWLEKSRLYHNVAEDLKSLKRSGNHHLRDAATKDQLREMLTAIDTSTPSGLRDYALVNLVARCGLRDCEVSRADIEDIRNEQGKRVLWVRGKGRSSKDEAVVLTERAEAPIRAWLVARGPAEPSAPLFCSFSDRNRGGRLTTRSISSIVKQSFRRVGIDDPKLSAHSLRHFFITELVLAGGAPVQVQAAARHASLDTTMGYFHNRDRYAAPVEELLDF
jgi:site-specific recombinase XerD